jgi:hypothetical protein
LPMPRPTTNVYPLERKETMVTLPIGLARRPGTHTITVDHPRRGRVRFDIVIPSYQPRLLEIAWFNPDGGKGAWSPGHPAAGPAIQPGAFVVLFATMLYTPDTKRWRLLDATSKLIASDSNVMISRVASHDNKRGACNFSLPSTIPPGTGYQLGVTTDSGLDSQVAGPLTFVAAVMPPPAPKPLIYVSIEQLDGGDAGYIGSMGYGAPTTKYSETDPKLPPGALQLAMAGFVGKYQFGPLTASEAAAGAPTWDFEGIDARTMLPVTGSTEAFTMVRAAVNIADLYDLSSVTIRKH